MKLSKQDQAIVLAQGEGYFLCKSTGDVYSTKRGIHKIRQGEDSAGYRYIGVKLPGEHKFTKTYLHLIVAYNKFGDQIFTPGVIVYHRDSNTLNNNYDNIGVSS